MKLLIFITISSITLFIDGCSLHRFETYEGENCQAVCTFTLEMCQSTPEYCKYKHKACLETCDTIEQMERKKPSINCSSTCDN